MKELNRKYIFQKFNELSEQEFINLSSDAVEVFGDGYEESIANAEFFEESEYYERAIDFYEEAKTFLIGQILFMQFKMLIDHCETRVEIN